AVSKTGRTQVLSAVGFNVALIEPGGALAGLGSATPVFVTHEPELGDHPIHTTVPEAVAVATSSRPSPSRSASDSAFTPKKSPVPSAPVFLMSTRTGRPATGNAPRSSQRPFTSACTRSAEGDIRLPPSSLTSKRTGLGSASTRYSVSALGCRELDQPQTYVSALPVRSAPSDSRTTFIFHRPFVAACWNAQASQACRFAVVHVGSM